MFVDEFFGNETKMLFLFFSVTLVIIGHRNMKWWAHDPETPTA
jgi:hypothetical protein